MKNFSLIAVFTLCFFSAGSQTYSGQLINTESGQPVPFANIGIIGRNIGTAADIDGRFRIELNRKFDEETLCISCIGYETRTFLIVDFKKTNKNNSKVKIELSPKTYQLKEMIIRPVKTNIYTLGNYCEPESPYGNAFYTKKLGTELGIIIKLPRKTKKAYLKKFRFYVGEFTYDSFPVRLNIYNLKNGLPNENILNESIFIDIISEGEYIVDLGKYHIVTSEDFFISLEFYRVVDSAIGELVFCSTQDRNKTQGKGYYRITSQGNWNPQFVANVGFSVVVECEK